MPEATLDLTERIFVPGATTSGLIRPLSHGPLLLKAASRERLNRSLRELLTYAGQQRIPWANLVVDVDAVSLL